MQPRIPPLTTTTADPEAAELLAGFSTLRGDDASVLNVFGTIAHHPALLRKWLVFATHVLLDSTLAPRVRELVVLRVGWRCASPYEWGQHIVVGRQVGLTDNDVRRVAEGPDAPGWTDAERVALLAVDELHDRNTVTETTWRELTGHFDTQQVIDLVFLVGQYHLVAFALNACGVQRDDGVDEQTLPFPAAAT